MRMNTFWLRATVIFSIHCKFAFQNQRASVLSRMKMPTMILRSCFFVSHLLPCILIPFNHGVSFTSLVAVHGRFLAGSALENFFPDDAMTKAYALQVNQALQDESEDEDLVFENDVSIGSSSAFSSSSLNSSAKTALLPKASKTTIISSSSSGTKIHSAEEKMNPLSTSDMSRGGRCDALLLRCASGVRDFFHRKCPPENRHKSYRETLMRGMGHSISVGDDDDSEEDMNASAVNANRYRYVTATGHEEAGSSSSATADLLKNKLHVDRYLTIDIKVIGSLAGKSLCESFPLVVTSSTPIRQVARIVEARLLQELLSESGESVSNPFAAVAVRKKHMFLQLHVDTVCIHQTDKTSFGEWLEETATEQIREDLLLSSGPEMTILATRVSALQHLRGFLEASPAFDKFDFWDLEKNRRAVDEEVVDPHWNPFWTELRVTEAFAGSQFFRPKKVGNKAPTHSEQTEDDVVQEDIDKKKDDNNMKDDVEQADTDKKKNDRDSMKMHLKRVKTADLLSVIFSDGDIMHGTKTNRDEDTKYLHYSRHLTAHFAAYASKASREYQERLKSPFISTGSRSAQSSATSSATSSSSSRRKKSCIFEKHVDELLVQYGESEQYPDCLEIALIHHDRLVLDPRLFASSSVSEYYRSVNPLPNRTSLRNMVVSTVTIRNSDRDEHGSFLAYGPIPSFWKNAVQSWQRN